MYNHSGGGGINKSRYMDGGGASSSGDSRYASDRNASSSSSSAWPNSGPGGASSGSKSFGSSGGGHIQSVVSSGGGIPDPWSQKQADSNWRSMDQNQDRYDRTYSERKSQVSTTQYMDAPRQNAFVGGGRPPQDRYGNSVSSRFDNSRF